ncbi:MAG: hypothetical protein NC342_09285 [Pseudoflavonifractor sp.]|nr:hypothetical protein [Alloprevotella sp.]MCM1117712.1 hypothetical protein [Pseudoflavonifractor sp.]
MTRVYLLLLFSLLLSASCSRQQQASRILDAIPAEATSVNFLDIPLLKKHGINPSSLSSFPSCRGIDKFASVAFADGSQVIIAKLPHADSIAASDLKPIDAISDDKNISCYASTDGKVMVVDADLAMAYFLSLPPSRALARVKELQAAATRASMSLFMGVASFVDRVSASSPCFGVVARRSLGGYSPNPDEPEDEQWLAYSASGEGNSASISLSLIEGSGKQVEIKGLQEINTDFLRYFSGQMELVCAIGLTPEMDWDAALAMVSLFPSRSLAQYIAIIKPYLKSVNGTVALAANNLYSTDNPRFLLMAHLDRDKIDRFMAQAGSLAAMAGASLKQADKSTAMVDIPSIGRVYLGQVDDNLVISSFEPIPDGHNSYAPAIEGHDAAAIVSISDDSPLGQPFTAEMAVDNSSATLKLITVPSGSDDPSALALLLRAFLY